jgi:hypothetical protein
MLVRARFLPKLTYHAIRYAIKFFSVLPVKKLLNKERKPGTPYELFYDKIPMINHFGVCDSPCVTRNILSLNQKDKKECQRYLHRIRSQSASLVGPPVTIKHDSSRQWLTLWWHFLPWNAHNMETLLSCTCPDTQYPSPTVFMNTLVTPPPPVNIICLLTLNRGWWS